MASVLWLATHPEEGLNANGLARFQEMVIHLTQVRRVATL
jgi:hypothetical protein